MDAPGAGAVSCLAWDAFPRLFQGGDRGGFHRMAYWDWPSSPDAPILVAVHGLTRNGRDFDGLAAAMADSWRVVCPDLPGRGASDRLSDPALYAYPQYLSDMAALIAGLRADRVDWLGTSLGGLLGMFFAAEPGTPVRRLILNDVGPFVPKAVLERIAAYVGQDPHFASLVDAEAYLRIVHAPFGPLGDEAWRHLALHSTRPAAGGGYRLAYDPAIGTALRAFPFADVDLWSVWDKVACPVLIVRGRLSDLLTAEIAAEMVRRKPDATLVEFADCGHAPALIDPAQIAAIRNWLDRTAGD
jgi:pimeloyl-ACP methyl ester carboxylesterase